MFCDSRISAVLQFVFGSNALVAAVEEPGQQLDKQALDVLFSYCTSIEEPVGSTSRTRSLLAADWRAPLQQRSSSLSLLAMPQHSSV
jgi:hypothetical protein